MTPTNQPTNEQGQPAAVAALQAAYGPPSQAGFGSAVFHAPSPADAPLEQAALAKYRYFVGDQWERFGERAWMGPWRAVYTRPPSAKRDIVAELRAITDRDARQSVEMLLDNVDEADQARAALSVVYDDPAAAELTVYTIGDGDALSGLVIAGCQEETGNDTILVFLFD